MQCKTVLKELDRFRTREIPEKLEESVAEHVKCCAECASELAGLRVLAATLAGLDRPAPRDLARRVLEQAMDKYGMVETALGKVWVGFNARGISMVYAGTGGADGFVQSYLGRRFRVAQPSAVPARYAGLVRRAAEGNAPQRLPLDLEGLTPFEQKVLFLLRQIPRGEVRPYFWLAREAGNPRAVRAVGTALARNPVPFLLPCHRVVPASGGVGNYAFGSPMKRALLEREGVPVEELDDLARGGVHYLGCRSTGIYCFPTCRDARRMKPENRMPFRNTAQAADLGYRPCRHCRP